MKITEYVEGKYLTMVRAYGPRANTESHFFYQLKNLLNSQGGDWVKVNKIPGLNSYPFALRKRKGDTYVYDDLYAIRGAHKAYNRGEKVSLNFTD